MTAGEAGAGRRILVIGVGNRFRHDDGAGLAAADLVEGARVPGAVVLRHEGEPLGLIDAWDEGTDVYLLDAVASDEEAGRVIRYDALVEPPPPVFSHRGTHALGLAEVVDLAGAVGRLPPRLVVVGIVGERFDAGRGLSPAARRGVRSAAERVIHELRERDGA